MTEIITHSEEETEKAGKDFAETVSDNVPLIALYGELGAGKTAFVRGFVSVLSPGSRVKSPTYTIVNEYVSGKIPVYHFDLYRLDGKEDVYAIGMEEYLSRGICISEWSERFEDELPNGAVKVIIKKTDASTRKILIDYT
ncbi:MAG: tRNA (adenosine(37)-N6)-threonylcarbamoyltransferase complex ATPase subunit type 1 TsaE [Clostridia bacterium]|nr:tRNA (adenosine(37)-N6)-threonylcarbamoyltransferase complex ATPase subunit type 1 TsaE [Clostridia bacterium]